MYYISMLLVIGSSIIYHMSQKSIPKNANPIISMLITYITAVLITGILLIMFPVEKNSFQSELKSINWSSFVLGIAIVALEMGFLYVYRSGWNISIASVFSNVLVMLLLIPVGIYFFKEKINITTITGVLFCIIGIFLIGKK